MGGLGFQKLSGRQFRGDYKEDEESAHVACLVGWKPREKNPVFSRSCSF